MDFLYNAKNQLLHQIEKYWDHNLPEQNLFLLRVSQPGPEKPSIKAPGFSFAQRKNENRKEKKNSIFIILNCIAGIISPQAGFKIQAKL